MPPGSECESEVGIERDGTMAALGIMEVGTMAACGMAARGGEGAVGVAAVGDAERPARGAAALGELANASGVKQAARAASFW